MDTLGLDEAGRGPVLGPMVMAGIVIPEKKEKIIERMGVKDSKRLTPNRRAVLYRKLTKMFDYETVVITAKDIDTLRAKGINLNQIEKLAMKKIINTLRADRIIIDALDVKEGRLQEEMEEYVGHSCEVIAEHKADDYALRPTHREPHGALHRRRVRDDGHTARPTHRHAQQGYDGAYCSGYVARGEWLCSLPCRGRKRIRPNGVLGLG
jgi:hypothetical protein